MNTLASIPRFWAWFQAVEEELSTGMDDDPRRAFGVIQSRVKEIDPRLSCEVGPGFRQENMLAISPGGQRELLTLTRRIIRQAPRLARWEFYPSKPPRSFRHLTFSNGIQYHLDELSFRLRRFPDSGRAEIFLAHPDCPAEAKASETLAYLILDSLLGEEMVIEQVDFADMISQPKGPSDEWLPLGELQRAMAFNAR